MNETSFKSKTVRCLLTAFLLVVLPSLMVGGDKDCCPGAAAPATDDGGGNADKDDCKQNDIKITITPATASGTSGSGTTHDLEYEYSYTVEYGKGKPTDPHNGLSGSGIKEETVTAPKAPEYIKKITVTVHNKDSQRSGKPTVKFEETKKKPKELGSKEEGDGVYSCTPPNPSCKQCPCNPDDAANPDNPIDPRTPRHCPVPSSTGHSGGVGGSAKTNFSDNNSTYGGASTSIASLHMVFNLGHPLLGFAQTPEEDSLWVSEIDLGPQAYSIGSLIHNPAAGYIDRRTGGGLLQQIRSGSGLCVVSALPGAAAGYQLAFYRPSQIVPKLDILTLDTVVGDPTVRIVVDNPGSQGGAQRLRVTEYRQGVESRTQMFSKAGNTWKLTKGDRTMTQTTVGLDPDNATITRQVTQAVGAQNVLISQNVTVKQDGRTIEKRRGVGANARVTQYTYEGNKVALIRKTEGGVLYHWERRFEMPPDAFHPYGLSVVAEPVGNMPLPANPDTDTATYRAQAHLTESFSTEAHVAVTREKKPFEGGQLIVAEEHRTGNLYGMGGVASPLHISRLINGGAWTTGAEIQTNAGGRVIYVKGEDGWGTRTDWTSPGVDPTAHRVLTETETQTTLKDGWPVADVSTQTVRVTTEEGFLLSETTSVYHDGTYQLMSEMSYTYDNEGHLTGASTHGRPLYAATWAAGKLVFEMDEEGVARTFSGWTWNGSPTHIVTHGALAAGGLPAMPDLATDLQYDAEGRLTLLSSNEGQSDAWAYDLQGRLVLEEHKHTVGAVIATASTTTDYSQGGRWLTKTLPGNLTRIIKYNLDGTLAGVTGTAGVPKTVTYGLTAAIGGGAYEWQQVNQGTAEPIWRKITRDMLGKEIAQVRPAPPGNAASTVYVGHIYAPSDGSLQQVDFGGELKPQDHAERAGLDNYPGWVTKITQDTVVEATQFRTQYQAEGYLLEDGVWWRVAKSEKGTVQVQLSGYADGEAAKTKSTDALGNVTLSTITFDATPEGGVPLLTFTETVSQPGNVVAVSVSARGVVRKAVPFVGANPVIKTYDAYARLVATNDGRVNAAIAYDPIFYHLESMTKTPVAGGGAAEMVAYLYYPPDTLPAGRVRQRTVNGQVTYFDHTAHGELFRVWGPAANPQEYTYDGAGRLSQMRTWRNDGIWGGATWPGSPGNGDVTTWAYHPGTSLVANKTDARGKAVGYGYFSSGRLRTRTWARGRVTSYSYNGAGELHGVAYDDATPDAVLSYDANGYPAGLTDAAGVHTLQFNAAGQLTDDSIAAGTGVLGGIEVQPARPLAAGAGVVVGRLNGLTVNVGGSAILNHTFDYVDGTGELWHASDGTHDATYGYAAGTDWLQTATLTRGGTEVLKATHNPDGLNRLGSIVTSRGGATLEAHTWRYDAAGRRDRDTLADGDYWDYSYDARGELTGGVLRQADATAWKGYAFGYRFDALGNRLKTWFEDEAEGASYTADGHGLNQYKQREVPGFAEIRGSVQGAAKVWVEGPGGTTAAVVQAEAASGARRFDARVPVANRTAAQHPALTVEGLVTTPAAEYLQEQGPGRLFVAKTPEVFAHDDDGNLTDDGRWHYTWDGENQLIGMEAQAGVPATAKKKLKFGYDLHGRRILKEVYAWTGAGYGTVPVSRTRFVWDGWLLVSELVTDAAAVTVVNTYLWGRDASGERQGAGGVGGLLAASLNGTQVAYGYDGRSNVTKLYDTASAALLADYGYGPFAEPLRASGALAKANPFQFSTHYNDAETGVLYAKLRYYQPGTGRWLSRDPIGERGGINLYGYVLNSPINFIDPLGLDVWVEGPSPHGDKSCGSLNSSSKTSQDDPKEPSPHKSVNVGDPKGQNRGYSFGKESGLTMNGKVYEDTKGDGEIQRYMKTTPEQDEQILHDLANQLGEDHWYGPTTCRSWSTDQFNKIKEKYKLQESPAPKRQ